MRANRLLGLALVLLAAGCASGGATAGRHTTPPPSTTRSGRPPASGPATPAPALPAALRGTVATYHDSLTRAGDYSGVPPAGHLAVSFRTRLDGQVYGQPLLVDQMVVVATEANYVYGVDPLTGAVLWRSARIGPPVPMSVLPCGDIDPEGITSTPVFVAATGRVYVVAEVGVGSRVEHVLAALDPRTGQVRSRVRVDPPGQDGRTEQARGALLAEDGYVYVTYGGLDGDCGRYHGYVVRVPEHGGSQRVYQTPSAREGAIWAPPGPVAAGHGDLYVAVGNGASTSSRWDHTDSVLELSPGLRLLGGFAPSTWRTDNAGDLDLGSSSPTLLPGGLVVQDGKRGTVYVLRAGHLGGVGSELSAAAACPSYGGTASAGRSVYLPCVGGLARVVVAPDGTARVAWRQTGLGGTVDGSPVLGGGDVFAVDETGSSLVVLGQRGGRILTSAPIGAVTRFATPMLAGGRVYVGTEAGLVCLTGG